MRLKTSNLTPSRTPYPASPIAEPRSRAPYPTSPIDTTAPPATLQLNPQIAIGEEEPYSPSLMTSPAFDLKPLNVALDDQQKRKDSGEVLLPESLRVGGGKAPAAGRAEGGESEGETKGEGVDRTTSQIRRDYQRGEVPDVLRPGSGAAMRRGENLSNMSHGSTASAASGPSPLPANMNRRENLSQGGSAEPGTTPPQSQANLESNPWAQSYTGVPLKPSSTGRSSPPKMSANLGSITPAEFSNYYPPISPSSSESSDEWSIVSPSAQAPEVVPPSHLRTTSTASTASSVWEPMGFDLSSLDASGTRAYPGRRGAPAVGMDGWREDALEEDAAARTWEEDLERRALAGAELQKQSEQAQLRQQEEAYQREFYEREHDQWDQQAYLQAPAKPPKSVSSGDEERNTPPASANNPWADQMGVPGMGLGRKETPEPLREEPTFDPENEFFSIRQVPLPGQPGKLYPVILQNENSHSSLWCALINAITLSTPRPVAQESGLAEVLDSGREQIAFSLLLQALFDELVTRSNGVFPDMDELFALFKNLNSGLSVNPNFIVGADGLGHFEKSKELDLLGSFGFPVIHGWLVQPDTGASAVLARWKTHKDSQTLLFKEQEMINRFTSTSALPSAYEHTLLSDAKSLRTFLESSGTQLTPFGLGSLTRNLMETQVAILYRNDHFSTVFRCGSLLMLVTDPALASHEEIVWEALKDANGRNNHFLSSDLRPIGGGDPEPAPERQQVQSLLDVDSPPLGSPQSVDEDYALALQMQEEEDALQRQHTRRSRRDSLRESVPNIREPSPRRQTTPRAPSLPRRHDEPAAVSRPPPANAEDAPPPYEYRPSGGHTSVPTSPAIGQGQTEGSAWMQQTQADIQRRGSAAQSYQRPAGLPPGSGFGSAAYPGSSRSTLGNNANTRGGKEQCVVM